MQYIVSEDRYSNYLAHIGVDHIKGDPGSGRYEWGSGKNRWQRAEFSPDDHDQLISAGIPEKTVNEVFNDPKKERKYQDPNFDYDEYRRMLKEGKSQKEIADHFNMTIEHLRDNRSIAKTYEVQDKIRQVADLYNSGVTSSSDISKKTGIPEATVRSYLNLSESAQNTKNAIISTADILSSEVDKKGIIDIGSGTEQILNVTNVRYSSAIKACENAGYNVYNLYQDQLGNNRQQTTVRVLCAPGMTKTDAIKAMQNAEIGLPIIDIHSEDNGLTFYGIEHPKSIDSSRVMANYDSTKDGLVEVRRGVEDVSLGKNNYAQVRIAVDGTHYIKGMAVYADDLPEGIDIRVNTNKSEGTPLISDSGSCCLKPMKRTKDGEIDYDNPFGAQIKMKDGVTVGQRHYTDKNGETQLSVINIIQEEGDWSTWRKSLSSQMLSKQSLDLINQQLDIAKEARVKEFEEINAITNPTVRKHLLISFADGCDKAAADLDAAAMPRQASHAILPIKSLKDNEIYAPNYRDGEKVILIRYPHGGTFEIPELIVNNRNTEARKMIGDTAPDAVGITQATAKKLSGADFDGDTVLVIPNNKNQISVNNSARYKELQDFDPNIYHKDGYEVSEDTKQKWMGKCTNLIADMSLMGAPAEDLIPAVKFSMVIIDSVKHELDWKQAKEDYQIDRLNEKYRGSSRAGASTIITRAGSEYHELHRRAARSNSAKGIVAGIDKETGKKVYEYTGKTRVKLIKDKKTGEIIGKEEVPSTIKINKMDKVEDAYELVGNKEDKKEIAYAEYANSLKNLANEARKISVNTENMKRNSAAVSAYSKEVASLNDKLKNVKNNSYRERQAQILANKHYFAAIRNGSTEYTKDERKRLKNECLAGARLIVGAKKPKLLITSKEWEAIEAGAVSSSILSQIISNASEDTIRAYAMPRTTQRSNLSYFDEAMIRQMANRPGVTQAEIADALGISASTVNRVLSE